MSEGCRLQAPAAATPPWAVGGPLSKVLVQAHLVTVSYVSVFLFSA